MKKLFVLGTSLVMIFAMSSCKSSESAYKKAYEKSQAQQTTVTTPVQPAQTTPVEVAPVQTQTTADVPVRTEDVTLVSGPALKAYSVVIGSFSIQANAEAAQKKINAQGYTASIVKSPSNMYRVAASSFNDKASAIQSRETLRSTYQDAWLLYQK